MNVACLLRQSCSSFVIGATEKWLFAVYKSYFLSVSRDVMARI